MKNHGWILICAGLLMLVLAKVGSAQSPGVQPVGTVRQLMLGMVGPASDVIFSVPRKAPKDDMEWAAVQNSALILGESANLLVMPSRAKDKGDWMKFAKQLNDAGAEAFKAANAKNAAALEDIGNKLDAACEACHEKYLPKPPQ